MKMKKYYMHISIITMVLFTLAYFSAGINQLWAQENTGETQDAAGLAKKLSNPIAAMISVPFQFNYDGNYGPEEEGSRYVLNFQPVIPISLNEDWNVISRTIFPFIYQDDIVENDSQSGLGDVIQSLFFSPKKPTSGGLIWGVGPVFLLPTATDDLLGGEKWGVGPTAVFLKQTGPWTYGALLNHIWSFAGEDDRADISSTFIQPFVSYTTPKAVTFSFNTESTYDWENEEWSVPLNVSVSKLVKIGKQPVSLAAGVRYWADSPDNGPDEWGVRLVATILFPK